MLSVKEEINTGGNDNIVEASTPPLDKDSPSFMSNDSSVHTPNDEPAITESMREEEEKLQTETEKENLKVLKEKAVADYDALVDKQRVQRLKFLLEKSSLYAQFLANKMERQQQEQRERAQVEESKRANAKEKAKVKQEKIAAGPTRKSTRVNTKITAVASSSSTTKQPAKKKDGNNKKRKANDADYNIADYVETNELSKRRKNSESKSTLVKDIKKEQFVEEEAALSNAIKQDDDIKKLIPARQPSLVTGGILRDYQLTGVEWLVSLYDNGLNGILADEMGLGKTLQTIAFFAYLWERQIYGPFLIVAPLSTLANWVSEFHRFTPTIPVVLYHGTPEQRSHIRTRRLKKLDHTFPVIVTSYEIVMNDRKYLQKFAWKYIVVDEGHRIKNLNCKLIRELKSYQSANRLLLTGTPLQNNLAELWSLLNFLLPDIFDDLDSFQDWFDFSMLHEQGGESRILANEQRRISFVCSFNKTQKECYDAIVARNIRPFLLAKKIGEVESEMGNMDNYDGNESTVLSSEEEESNSDSIQDQKEEPALIIDEAEAAKKAANAAKEFKTMKVVKTINGMKLQNVVMQLRKICNHPYLFDWPIDPEVPDQHLISEELIASAGKMMLLEKLLQALFERDHKVLIFSQFTTMLDIIEEWATTFKDGIFVELMAVDWNPQMDLQAQDRVHRIGQTKPVIIYRLVTANTVENNIIERATAKRKLEKLVIHKGKFKLPTSREVVVASLTELAEILATEDNEKVQLAEHGDEIIPEADLIRLMDRSEEAFAKVGTSEVEEERGEIYRLFQK
ncbi:unnamed protein product [Rhizophagus irregularis]|nr:unnamed protein product [Rhizophagus irregularis]